MAYFVNIRTRIPRIYQSGINKSFIRSLKSRTLIYEQFGEPVNVVQLRETELCAPGPKEVLVRMKAAPLNPADINTIQGKYPVKVSLPCIPGNEGVGVVEETGQSVQDIRIGDTVIVTKSLQGTWRDFAVFNREALKVVPKDMGIVEAATLTVNPCTAYRMLTDFKTVRDGCGVVIQNGANGACGQMVIQLCKAWRIPNVNIVRNRSDIDDLKKYLESLGATLVLTEEELRKTTIFKEKKMPKPTLALNCVGGKNALEVLRHLDHSGTMVTYGGMSREPITVPTSAFIFKNIELKGFWMTQWNEDADPEEKDEMLTDLIALIIDKKLKGPLVKMVNLNNYQNALADAMAPKGFGGGKYILTFD